MKANKANCCSKHSVSFPTLTCHLIYSHSQTTSVQLFALNANPILELESIPVACLFPTSFRKNLVSFSQALLLGVVPQSLSRRINLIGWLLTTFLLMRKRSRIHILFLASLNSFYQLMGAVVFSKMDLRNSFHQINPQRGCTQNSLQTCFGLYDTPSFPLAFLLLLPPPLVGCYIFMEYLDSSW